MLTKVIFISILDSNDCLLGAFVYKSPNQQCYEIPTSATWSKNLRNGVIISYINSFIGIFDRITVVFFNFRVKTKELFVLIQRII